MIVRPRPSRLLPVLLVAVALATGPSSEAAGSEPARGTGGAVASGEAVATEVGLDTLRAGGNAIDAAVATALALAVVHPEAGNLGGGGFAVVLHQGETYSLDFREVAPAAATTDLYLDAAGEPIPQASLVGPLAAGVPGSPHGLWALHQRFGRLPWIRVVEPAIELAGGFPISRRTVRRIEAKRELLEAFEETASILLPDGEPPLPGQTMVLEDLRRTLTLYAEKGPAGITQGEVALAVERASREHGGILTAADMASYRAVWREPLLFDAFGWSFASIDLPSTGGILLGQGLAMLEHLDWASRPRFGADRAHLLAEVWRRGFSDRFLLGDPSTTEATSRDLLEPGWVASRAETIEPDRASESRSVEPWTGDTAPAQSPAESADTTHLSVADAEGNLVAITTTLNGTFGCGLLVPGAGFLLNNEMDDFATAPGRPNAYDLVQGEANSVRPGRRMASSMTPTIARRGAEAIVIGGRGGSQIPTATKLAILNVIVDGDSLQQALDRPRVHHQWLPDRILAEPEALGAETRAALERRGHTIVVGHGTLAKVHAVRRFADGTFAAAADPRGPGVAAVVEPREP